MSAGGGTGRGKPFVFHVLTLFPGMIAEAASYSVLGKALDAGLVRLEIHDIRDHAADRHRTVDDEPYGGGPGMVMKVEPVVSCLRAARAMEGCGNLPAYLMSASGRPFVQAEARRLASGRGVILVCGHYEGVDERVAAYYVDGEFSIGDYVLSGGELPALVVVDAVARLIPGVVGNELSLAEESFEQGMLEYPQYTRPRVFEGHGVPEVLISGNHAAIKSFRRKAAMDKTRRNRPDLPVPDPPRTGVPVLGRPPDEEQA